MTTATNHHELVRMLSVNETEVPIIGYIVWWSMQGVEVNRKWFERKLNENSFDGERFAREHNYRSTLIRCLKLFEQQRLIRKVKEDADYLVYQFTKESLIDDDNEPQLSYERETTISIDKDAYVIDGDIEAAIEKCDPAIKRLLVDRFNQAKDLYNSSDMTRYVQNIFNHYADFVPLRDQGSVYFVPAAYKSIIDKMASILSSVPKGSAQFAYFPIIDDESSRRTIGNGVAGHLTDILSKIERELDDRGNDATEAWAKTRIFRIRQVLNRARNYEELIDGEIKEHAERLINRASRVLIV